MAETIKNRYEFVVLFDVENGNPNGDPDAGNMPRIDPETGYGIVTDVCLKRKIRNYVETVCDDDKEGYRIYIKENVPLNRSDREALERGTGTSEGRACKGRRARYGDQGRFRHHRLRRSIYQRGREGSRAGRRSSDR